MQNKDKQIEEMAKATCKSRFKQDEPLCKKCTEKCIYREIAKLMSDAGYRKQSDVAEEIFAEIERFLVEKLSSINAFRKKGDSFYDGEIHALELLLYKNAELKKKYTEGE